MYHLYLSRRFLSYFYSIKLLRLQIPVMHVSAMDKSKYLFSSIPRIIQEIDMKTDIPIYRCSEMANCLDKI
jgi:hypothetical protein